MVKSTALSYDEAWRIYRAQSVVRFTDFTIRTRCYDLALLSDMQRIDIHENGDTLMKCLIRWKLARLRKQLSNGFVSESEFALSPKLRLFLCVCCRNRLFEYSVLTKRVRDGQPRRL